MMIVSGMKGRREMDEVKELMRRLYRRDLLIERILGGMDLNEVRNLVISLDEERSMFVDEVKERSVGSLREKINELEELKGE